MGGEGDGVIGIRTVLVSFLRRRRNFSLSDGLLPHVFETEFSLQELRT